MHRRTLGAVAVAVLLSVLAVGPATAGPTAGTSRSALIVGMSAHFRGRPAAPVGGAGDAAAMREALRRAGWADSEVRVLTGADATAANIRAGLQWLADRSTEGGFTVFHYSGHVYQRTGDPDHDGEDKDEFIVPYDATNIISDHELAQRLDGVRGWLWTNVSGCEAAGFEEGLLSGPHRLFTASSQEVEKGYERPDWGMSVYTGLMANEGMNKGRGDANNDGRVSIQEAFAFAAREAPLMTQGQRKGVQHPFMAGGDGGEWFLNPPPAAPPPAPAGSQPPAGAKKLCLLPGICI
ncbi:MAG TPA: caspase family protein [Solirubrobacterales bacterium]|nr:caspase family protein [Solirubrobacterales bacterium]